MLEKNISFRFSVCLVKNRYRPSSVHLNTDDWIAHLNATYGSRRVVVVSPSYASVFGGTLFESTYINSEELTFLGPALVWALLWKYGGLLLKSNTLLLSPLQSYYNLIALKPSGKGMNGKAIFVYHSRLLLQ